MLAYAEDEAEALGRTGACLVVLHADGSLSVSDDGRGTDTRRDATGDIIRKPVMSTPDLRFFDSSDVDLPDGHPRRGISVVAALSRWLVHTNRRAEGSWTQRYELGVPTAGLVPVWSSGTTGTLVHFLPDRLLLPRPADADELRDLATRFSWLDVEVATE